MDINLSDFIKRASFRIFAVPPPFRQNDDVVADKCGPTFRIESQNNSLSSGWGIYNDCGGNECLIVMNNMRKKLYLLKMGIKSNFNFLRERKTA